METEHIHLHLLNLFPEFGPARLNRLLGHFSSPGRALKADPEEIRETGIEKKVVDEFLDFRKRLNPEKEIKKLEQENIQILGWSHSGFPEELKQIHPPPVILYYKGNLDFSQRVGLAVVGSRKNSDYGVRAIEEFLPPVLKGYQEELSIISGLALGIDAQAHATTISNRGHTTAILGCGPDKNTVFPPRNRELAEKILDSGGALVSEFPPGTPALKYHFPQRNRIISGLSRALLVVEAEKRSGALITADLALEQNKEIMAVPGNIFSPSSRGTNKLIQKGAHPVTGSRDIAEILGLTPRETSLTNNKSKPELADKEEEKVFQCLQHSPVHINHLANISGLDITTLNTKLTQMEIKGLVRNVGGMKFIKLN